jgi:hypothetical protein
MAVDNQAPDDIDPEVGGAAMPGRLNLGDMLELVKVVSTLARKRARNWSVSRIRWFFLLRLGWAQNSMPAV